MSLHRPGPTPAGGPDDRLGGVRRVKLRALVRASWAPSAKLVDGAIPGGATLSEVGGPRGWVLIDDGAVSGFGAALAWGLRHERSEMHVLVEDRGLQPAPSAIIARRAGEFASGPSVWRAEERTLTEAEPASRDPEPGAGLAGGVGRSGGGSAERVSADVFDAMAAEISAHGADPVVEHGILRAEVLGVEVARVVPDSSGGWHLAVGVGRHDRDARKELRPGEPTAHALHDVVELVTMWRTPGARRHPANMLAPERWLRAVVMSRPEIAGAVALTPVPPPLPRTDLRAAASAGAIGVDPDGHPIVVVCSTGVDVDLVPTAADTRLLHAPDARLILVVPAVDAYPLTRELARSLRRPADIRTVASDWATLLES